jgi:septal ring factor EnvC (AmiA/AmiB activator)
MKPVRTKIRRHFGLTAKRVAVRSQRPWYFRLLLALLCVATGYALAFWMLRDEVDVREQLRQTRLENKALEAKLVGAQRELQVELATNNTLAKEFASVQDENIKIKEELFFYKNMVSKRAR